MMWPPIVRTLSTYLKGSDYVKATVYVAWASAAGTILMYLVSPLIIELKGWQYVFVFSAIVGAVSAALVLPGLSRAEASLESFAERLPDDTKATENSTSSLFRSFAGLFVVASFAIATQGILRDGTDAWMPSYISEVFDLGTSMSILTGVILPAFAILCHKAASMVYNKIKDELLSSGLFFGVAALALIVLSFVATGGHPAIAVACFAVISGCMHATNLILVCILPRRFAKYGRISTLSGFFNFSTYVGSALSIYGFAALSRRVGWTKTAVVWTIISLCGAAFCFLLYHPLKKLVLSENKTQEKN